MTGPRKLIDLDNTPRSKWSLRLDAVHLYNGKMWNLQQLGCVLCAAEDVGDYQKQTLQLVDNHERYECLTHGELLKVAYRMERTYSVTLGGVCRTATMVQEDFVLFPTSMTEPERMNMIASILDETENEEKSSDVFDIDP